MSYIFGQTNHLYTKKGAFEPYFMKKKKTITYKYSQIPRGYTQVLSKKPFFLIEAMELQKFVYRRKYLTRVCICDMVFEQNK